MRIFTILAALLVGIQLGRAPLLDPDEGRNAAVAREMAETNDYLVPHLNRIPYLDKPIVYFGAEALFMEVLGPTALAARLPAYLFTLATALLLYLYARRLWGEERAAVSAIAYLAMPLTIVFARTVIFDSALTFFIVAAILAFREAVERRDRRWATAAWAAIALGVLTKGPVAILLPLLVAIPYALWRRAFRWLWSVPGLIAFLAIITPWVWSMQRVVPDFLEYVLVTETAARLTTDELKRTGPPWYFLPYLIGGALPWSIALLSKPVRRWREDHEVLFLLLWILLPLVFFSLSQSKRPQYILPLLPAMGLLIGKMWPEVRLRSAAAIGLVVGLVLVIAPFIPQLTTKMRPVIVEPARWAAFGIGGSLLVAGTVALVARGARARFLALALAVLLLPLVTAPLMMALGERRSTKSFVARMGTHLQPQTQLIGVEAFTGSLSFYTGRPIIVATEDGSEWTSNYVLRRYDRYSRKPGSPLRPMSWLDQNLRQCCPDRIYIVRNDDRAHRQRLEQLGLSLIAEGPHHVAYREPRMPAAGPLAR